VFTFQFLSDKIYNYTKKAILHLAIEKETLILSQFSLMTGFFEGTRENIIHIFQALVLLEFPFKVSGN
jgi:hypothetical protein